jgi:hypothetical protein
MPRPLPATRASITRRFFAPNGERRALIAVEGHEARGHRRASDLLVQRPRIDEAAVDNEADARIAVGSSGHGRSAQRHVEQRTAYVPEIDAGNDRAAGRSRHAAQIDHDVLDTHDRAVDRDRCGHRVAAPRHERPACWSAITGSVNPSGTPWIGCDAVSTICSAYVPAQSVISSPGWAPASAAFTV